MEENRLSLIPLSKRIRKKKRKKISVKKEEKKQNDSQIEIVCVVRVFSNWRQTTCLVAYLPSQPHLHVADSVVVCLHSICCTPLYIRHLIMVTKKDKHIQKCISKSSLSSSESSSLSGSSWRSLSNKYNRNYQE